MKGGGEISIPEVPYGRYVRHVWSKRMGPDSGDRRRTRSRLEKARRWGVIRAPAASGLILAHKNKYGRDYDAPIPDNSVYREQR